MRSHDLKFFLDIVEDAETERRRKVLLFKRWSAGYFSYVSEKILSSSCVLDFFFFLKIHAAKKIGLLLGALLV